MRREGDRAGGTLRVQPEMTGEEEGSRTVRQQHPAKRPEPVERAPSFRAWFESRLLQESPPHGGVLMFVPFNLRVFSSCSAFHVPSSIGATSEPGSGKGAATIVRVAAR